MLCKCFCIHIFITFGLFWGGNIPPALCYFVSPTNDQHCATLPIHGQATGNTLLAFEYAVPGAMRCRLWAWVLGRVRLAGEENQAASGRTRLTRERKTYLA